MITTRLGRLWWMELKLTCVISHRKLILGQIDQSVCFSNKIGLVVDRFCF